MKLGKNRLAAYLLFSCIMFGSEVMAACGGSSCSFSQDSLDVTTVRSALSPGMQKIFDSQSTSVQKNAVIIAHGLAHIAGKELSDLTPSEAETAFTGAEDLQKGQLHRFQKSNPAHQGVKLPGS